MSPNYSVINELLIDTRNKRVVKCLNRYIQKVEIYEPIEEIGDYAFINCGVLYEVILPDSIRIIGESAFQHCEMLNRINLPDSIETISKRAFFNCNNLHINHLPNKIAVIGDSAFQWSIIDGINISKSIVEVGKDPFSKNTKNITSDSPRFIIEKSLLIDIDNNELIQLVDSTVKQISIPEYITKIKENAFIHTDIESIIIPYTVQELGDGLFWGCRNLKEIRIDCKIDKLPNSIFAYCSSLASFDVPQCIKTIETGAFYQCINLLEINLSSELRIVGNRAFEGCTNLVSLNIPESIESIGDNFGSCFKDCKNLKYFFYDAREAKMSGLPHSIQELVIGPHVKKLPKNFLANNSALETLVIPKNVQWIEKGCIEQCSNLREISIVSKDIVVEDGWIRNCKSLRTIKIHVKTYEQIRPLIPKEQNIKVKQIYDNHFWFFKW